MNKIEKQVEQVLMERRRRAISVCEKNLKVARENLEFKNLEGQEVELTIALANLLADDEFVDVTKKRIELSELKAKKFLALKKLGMEEKDISPNYICSLCLDTGRNNCSCRTEIKNKILLKNAGIEGNLESFSNAKPNGKEFDRAIELLKQWSEKFPNVSKQNIFISGPTGVGKTFITKCLINQLVKGGVYVYFTTAFNLNQTFLSYCKAREEEKDELLKVLLEPEVLLIDDLGTEPIINNITLNYLYLILNERLVGGKGTIINSNLDAEGIIDRYGERIFSRVLNKRNGIAIRLLGEDLRLKK